MAAAPVPDDNGGMTRREAEPMPSRRFVLSLLASAVLPPSALADDRGGALIVRPARPAAPLSTQIGALLPLVHDAALGLELQRAWRCFSPEVETRMRSTLAWAQDAASRPGFGELRPGRLKAVRRQGREAAMRLVSQGAETEAALAMRASIRDIFARDGHGR